MRKLVTIRIINKIKPIEGADKIEIATVDGWEVVVRKNEFKVGDKCLYFEIDSFLPVKPEYEFLLRGSKPKKMLHNGKEIEGIRLKTIKLRGQISQGLILPVPQELTDCDLLEDVSEKLGVIKYERPIPASLSGQVKGDFPSFIPKTDEERIQNMVDILDNYVVSEKIDGCSVTFYKKDGIFGVCSRNLELQETNTTQWKLAKKYNLKEIMPDNFALQGEIIGEGIQKNSLKINGQDVYFFDAYNIESGIYLKYQDFICLCNKMQIKTVPIIDDNFILSGNINELLKYAEGKSKLNSDAEREGIVIRSKGNLQYKGARLSFKVISNKYLIKND